MRSSGHMRTTGRAVTRHSGPQTRAVLACRFGAEFEDGQGTHRPGSQQTQLLVVTRFLPLDDLKTHGRLPRHGHDNDFKHPLTGEPNVNLCKP